MNSLIDRLHEEILRIPIVDPCLHLDPRRPAAAGLDELIGSPDLAAAAGGRAEGAGGAGPAGLRLPPGAGIVVGGWIAEIASKLLGVDPTSPGGNGVEALREAAAGKMAAPGWEREVLARTGLERGIVALPFDDRLDGFDRDRYVPGLDAGPLVFGLADPAGRARLAATTGVEVIHLKSLGRALEAVVGRFASSGARSWTLSVPPGFSPLREEDGTAGAALSKALAGKANALDRTRVSRRAFWELAGCAAAVRIPLVLRLEGTALPGEFRDVVLAFPELPIAVSSSSPGAEGELIGFARSHPSASLLGHPGIAGLPAFVDRSLRARLQGVPAERLIGFSTEVYRLEFALPKFNMYRRILAAVLAEELIEGRRWGEEEALGIARALLRENPALRFGLASSAGGTEAGPGEPGPGRSGK